MIDIERNKLFEEKKQETIDRLLGKDSSYPVLEDVQTYVIDSNWNKGKPFYNNPRIIKNSRNTIDSAIYNFQIRDTGVVISVIDTPLGEEAPVIK